MFGVDVLQQQATFYKNRRIDLLRMMQPLHSNGILSRVALQSAGFQIIKLFSPEHGIARIGADGAAQPDALDKHTDLPIISLYGNKLASTESDLNNIDLLIFDVPDIGCRFYTYLWTLTHVMEAAAKYTIPLLILDRPNPTGADIKRQKALGWMNCIVLPSLVVGIYPSGIGCNNRRIGTLSCSTKDS
jgi:uncharacterized protein YbbC (DUF1343 family)